MQGDLIMRQAKYNIDRDSILEKTFNYLVKNGLENITIRELCKGTGIAQGSLYYWFDDKTNIICESTEYGFETVSGKIFEYAFSAIDDLEKFFKECMSNISLYKDELRFIYQMAASPIYGERIRAEANNYEWYKVYSEKLSKKLGCSSDDLLPLVYLFISTILNYVIWEKKEGTADQLKFIYTSLAGKIHKNNGIA